MEMRVEMRLHMVLIRVSLVSPIAWLSGTAKPGIRSQDCCYGCARSRWHTTNARHLLLALACLLVALLGLAARLLVAFLKGCLLVCLVDRRPRPPGRLRRGGNARKNGAMFGAYPGVPVAVNPL